MSQEDNWREELGSELKKFKSGGYREVRPDKDPIEMRKELLESQPTGELEVPYLLDADKIQTIKLLEDANQTIRVAVEKGLVPLELNPSVESVEGSILILEEIQENNPKDFDTYFSSLHKALITVAGICATKFKKIEIGADFSATTLYYLPNKITELVEREKRLVKKNA